MNTGIIISIGLIRPSPLKKSSPEGYEEQFWIVLTRIESLNDGGEQIERYFLAGTG
jgi:hypothetical protein